MLQSKPKRLCPLCPPGDKRKEAVPDYRHCEDHVMQHMGAMLRGSTISRHERYIADAASVSADAMVAALNLFNDQLTYPGVSAEIIARFGDLWEVPESEDDRVRVLDALAARAWASSSREFAQTYLRGVAERASLIGDSVVARRAIVLRIQGSPVPYVPKSLTKAFVPHRPSLRRRVGRRLSVLARRT